MFSCEFCKIFKNTFFKDHIQTTVSIWAVFLGNIIILKVCFQAVTSANNAEITKGGLQRSKDNKGRITKKTSSVEHLLRVPSEYE